MLSHVAGNFWAFYQKLPYPSRGTKPADVSAARIATCRSIEGRRRVRSNWTALCAQRTPRSCRQNTRRRAGQSTRCPPRRRSLRVALCHTNEEASSGGLDSPRSRLTTLSNAPLQPRQPAITSSANESFWSARLPRGFGSPRALCLRARTDDAGGLRCEAEALRRDDGIRALSRRPVPGM